MEINIYQGGNSPIILETPFNLNTIEKIEASLWIFGTELKHWSTDDIITGDNKFVILPMNENETIGFKSGTGKLEIKMLNNQDEIILFEDITATVLGKSDKTRLTEGNMKVKGRIFEWFYDDIVRLPELDRDSMEKLKNYIENLGDSAFSQGYNYGLNDQESECNGCAFEDVEEWEMPCAKCKRACKDYWRKKA